MSTEKMWSSDTQDDFQQLLNNSSLESRLNYDNLKKTVIESQNNDWFDYSTISASDLLAQNKLDEMNHPLEPWVKIKYVAFKNDWRYPWKKWEVIVVWTFEQDSNIWWSWWLQINALTWEKIRGIATVNTTFVKERRDYFSSNNWMTCSYNQLLDSFFANELHHAFVSPNDTEIGSDRASIQSNPEFIKMRIYQYVMNWWKAPQWATDQAAYDELFKVYWRTFEDLINYKDKGEKKLNKWKSLIKEYNNKSESNINPWKLFASLNEIFDSRVIKKYAHITFNSCV